MISYIETDLVQYVAGLSGTITVQVYNATGNIQDLTGYIAVLNICYEYDDDAIISLPMTILANGICTIDLKPSNTTILDRGEYEFQINLFYGDYIEHATKRVKLTIDKAINTNYSDEQLADVIDSTIDGGTF